MILSLPGWFYLKAVWYFIHFTLFCTSYCSIDQKDGWNKAVQTSRVITEISHNFGKILNAFFILNLIQTF